MKHVHAALLGVTLASTACLEPNPDFIEPTADGAETGDDGCPEGLLDCDDEPGCEADANDPSHCGSCGKTCELNGEMLECVAGQCVGTVFFTELADAYIDSEQPSQNFGVEPTLIVDQSRASYVALPELDTLVSGGKLDYVGLHLTCTQAGTTVQVQRVQSVWDELQVSASTAPSGSNVIGDFDFGPGETVIELTDELPNWIAPKRSLRFNASGADPLPVLFSSREGGSAPYLEVTIRW
jgi:hypothetical protein